jgi:hypothetical protein
MPSPPGCALPSKEDLRDRYATDSGISGVPRSALAPDSARVDQGGLEYSDLSPLAREKALWAEAFVWDEHRGFWSVEVIGLNESFVSFYIVS